jgi:AcrR family transcriptional regulator
VDEARRVILDAAECRLAAGGPDAVRVQLVGRDVGLTDAAVHYHFESRQGLLEALLHRAGRRMRDELTEAVSAWDAGSLDVGDLVARIRETYEARQYARLTAWMRLAGWRPRGAGMLRAHAGKIHRSRVERAAARSRPEPDAEDTAFAIVLIHLVVWAGALIGDSSLRMVGLPGDRSTVERFMDWFTALLSRHVRDEATP